MEEEKESKMSKESVRAGIFMGCLLAMAICFTCGIFAIVQNHIVYGLVFILATYCFYLNIDLDRITILEGMYEELLHVYTTVYMLTLEQQELAVKQQTIIDVQKEEINRLNKELGKDINDETPSSTVAQDSN